MPTMFIRAFFVLISLNLSLSLTLNATHLVGGEIQMSALQGNNYRIRMNLYMDQFGAATPSASNAPVHTVRIFSKFNSQLVETIQLPKVNQGNVPYSNPSCAVGTLATIALEYSAVITLNPQLYSNQSGYYIEWNSCCRNFGINNIINPGGTGSTLRYDFPAIVTQQNTPFINSSPASLPVIGDYACAFQPFIYDYSAADPDGDSIAYSLATPLGGVFWAGGLSETNQIPGPQPLTISPSGVLSFTPSTVGLYLFGIKMEEYRNGQVIGVMYRDFQLYVLACGGAQNNPTVFAVKEDGFSLTRNDTIKLTGNNLCVSLKGIDIDTNTNLTMIVQGLNFPSTNIIPSVATGSVNTINDNDTTTLSFCLRNSCGRSDSLYRVRVILIDNTCPLGRRDTITFWIKAFIPTNRPPKLVQFNPLTGAVIPPGDTVNIDASSRCLTFYCIDPDTLTTLNMEVFALNFNLNLISQIINTGTVNTVNDSDTVVLSFCLPECTPQTGNLLRLRIILNDQACNPRLTDSLFRTVRLFSSSNSAPQVFAYDKVNNVPIPVGDTVRANPATGCITLAIVDTDTVSSGLLSFTSSNFSSNLVLPFNQVIRTNFQGVGDTAFIDVCFTDCPPQVPAYFRAQVAYSDITCPTALQFGLNLIIEPYRPINTPPKLEAYNPVGNQAYAANDTILIYPSNTCIKLRGIDTDKNSILKLAVTPINTSIAVINGFINSGSTNTGTNPTDTAQLEICFRGNWTCADSLWTIQLVLSDTGCYDSKTDTLILYVKPVDTINTPPKIIFFDNASPTKSLIPNADTLLVSAANNCLSYYVVDSDTNTTLSITIQVLNSLQSIITSYTQTVFTNTFNDKDTAVALVCFDECSVDESGYLNIRIKVKDGSCDAQGVDSVDRWIFYKSLSKNRPGLLAFDSATLSPFSSLDTIALSPQNNCFTIKLFDQDSNSTLYPDIVSQLLPFGFSYSLIDSVKVNTLNLGDTASVSFCLTNLNWPCGERIFALDLFTRDNGCYNNLSDTLRVFIRSVEDSGVPPSVGFQFNSTFYIQNNDTIFLGNDRCFDLIVADPDTLSQVDVTIQVLSPSSQASSLIFSVQPNSGIFGDTIFNNFCLPKCTPDDSVFTIKLTAVDPNCPDINRDSITVTIITSNIYTNPAILAFDSTTLSPFSSLDTIALSPQNNCFTIKLFDQDSNSTLYPDIVSQLLPFGFSYSLIDSVKVNTLNLGDTASVSFCLTNLNWPCGERIFALDLFTRDNGCYNNLSDTLRVFIRSVEDSGVPPSVGFQFNSTFYIQNNDTIFLGNDRCFDLIVADPDTLSQVDVTIQVLSPSSQASSLSFSVQPNSGIFGDTIFNNFCLPNCTPGDTVFTIKLFAIDPNCSDINRDSITVVIITGIPSNQKPEIWYDRNQQTLNISDTITILPSNGIVNLFAVDTDTLSLITAQFIPLNFSNTFLQSLVNIGFTNTFNDSDTASLSFMLMPCIPGNDSILKVLMIYSDTGCLGSTDSVVLHLRYQRNSEPDPIVSGLTPNQLFVVNKDDSLSIPFTVLVGDSTTLRLSLSSSINNQIGLLQFSFQDSLSNGSLSTVINAPFSCEGVSLSPLNLFLIIENTGCNVNLDSIPFSVQYNYPNIAPALFVNGIPANTINSLNVFYDSLSILELIASDADFDLMEWVYSGAEILNFTLNSEEESMPGMLKIKTTFIPSCRQPIKSPVLLGWKVTDLSCLRASSETQIELNFLENQSTLQALPNIVTPNGDGFNDYFSISQVNWSCKFKNISIKDRWGRQVLYDTNPEFRWDANGLTDGQYFYFIEFEGTQVNGYIMVMR